MAREKLPRPARRPVPNRVSFGAPHAELFRQTHKLASKLDGSESGLDLGISLYSTATQVFAAMTIEATLNFYAVVRFGQEYYEHVQWMSAPRRFHVLFGDLSPPALLEEARQRMRRLFTRRNYLVHPNSGEYHFEWDGRPKSGNPPEVFVLIDSTSAREAVEDMDRLIVIMRSLDAEISMMLRM